MRRTKTAIATLWLPGFVLFATLASSLQVSSSTAEIKPPDLNLILQRLEDRRHEIDPSHDVRGGLRVLAGAVERLDSEVLLNPFEEQLHGPPRLVDLSDHMSRESEVVGEELEPLFRFRIQIGDGGNRFAHGSGAFGAQEHRYDGSILAPCSSTHPGCRRTAHRQHPCTTNWHQN